MGDSSDEDFDNEWIPYSKRPDWKDVTPLEQDDGENPVVVIAYSEKFKDVYNYFRAILASGEKSWRALHLTNDALKLNASNYTVWQYRREILRELNGNFNDELEYIEEIICRNPKSYQVWHHRRVIVEWLNDGSKELDLTEQVLNMDAKNYHAWQHRQWAIKTFDLFEDELIFVDRLIGADLRNNSAWNQRYFVLNHTGFTPDVIQFELTYVMNRIRLVKNNESTWNFLRGLLQHDTEKLDQFPEVVEFCEELYASGVRSPFLLAFLVDLYQEKRIDFNESESEDDPKQLEDKVADLCHMLMTTHDTIRAKYWEFISNKFKIKLGHSVSDQETSSSSNPNQSHTMIS